jgi:hypothetical protein
LGVGAGIEVAGGRVVGLHGLRGDPRQAPVRRYRRVRLVQVSVDERIAGKAEKRGAVGEEIDVPRANDMLAVDVALSVAGATAVDVAAVVEAALAATVLDVDVEGVELEVSARIIASTAPVDVALVEVAVSAATMLVLKVPTMMRLARRTLAAENAIVCAFMQLIY